MIAYLRSYLKSKIVRLKNPSLRKRECLSLDFIDKIRQKEDDGTPEFLLPFSLSKPKKGYCGAHKELIPVFEGVELGTWAIDSVAMDFFWRKLNDIRPNVILEYGSGSSTCLFASWMAKNNPGGLIVSVDQKQEEAIKTKNRISQLGLSAFVHVIVLPLNKDDEFIIDKNALSQAMQGRKVDFLFSDGPAGRPGCRMNTLPDSISLLNDGASWVLHDALRIPELNILKDWTKFRGVKVEGVVPIGKGLGVGVYHEVS